MTSAIRSEKLQNAFAAAVDEDLARVLASRPAVKASAGFEARMERLLEREKRPSHRLVNAYWKRALAAALAAVLLLAFLGFSSKRIRSSIAGFWVELFGDHVEYSDPAITKTSIEEEYGLVPVPEGFEEGTVTATAAYLCTNYYKNGTILSLEQMTGKDAGIAVDNENGTFTEIALGEKTVRIYLAEDCAQAAWTENGYLFSLTYSAAVESSQFQEWIMSVKQK